MCRLFLAFFVFRLYITPIMDKEIREIVYALLNESATDAEHRKLEEWLQEEPAHRLEYDGLLEECLYVRWAQEEGAVDPATSEKAIRDGIKRRIRRRHMWYYSGVACAAVVALVLVWSSLLRSNDRPVAMLADAAAGEILPRAMLVLSDGSEVEVGGLDTRIEEKNGWKITVKADGKLDYEQAKGTVAVEAMPIYNKIRVPRGGEYYLKLDDGTEVWLNSDSELEYPVRFSGKKRDVKLLRGEAYFRVRRDQERSFSVRSGEFSLRVYGTEFNLNTYEEQRLELVLVEGSVGFTGKPGMEEKILAPDQLAVVDGHTGESEVSDVYTLPYIAWKGSDLIFADEPLESILKKLERRYDLKMVYKNEAVKKLRFDINVPRYDNITSLFYYMEKISDVRFFIEGRTVHVDKRK